MSRETKIGLLVGMALIIMIGVLISDHLSGTPQQNPNAPELTTPQPPVNAQDPSLTSPDHLEGPAVIRQPLPPSQEDRRQPTGTDRNPRRTAQLDLREVDRMTDQERERERIRRIRSDDGRTEVTLPGPDAERIDAELSPNELRQRLEAERQSGIPEYHDVESGEVLSLIAQKHYGASRYYHQIYQANKDVMDSPGDIYVGMRLKLPRIPGVKRWVPEEFRRQAAVQPRRETDARESRPVNNVVVVNGVQYQKYTIRQGDGLFRLAQRFYGSGGKSNELYQLNRNRIADPDRLTVGQVILVPKIQ